ncbi:signal peptidase I [Amycolatopsis jiangsuensis]|uniref:Signal peptidase I n=1 Tax=Amycolatopsis jiangsuensis TaxID=1181879 RepID=A0A840IR88_9PSEU|nr:signal peptidase I [Amycolatopsis jiangsuensis]MBB4683688.1 signal peptidase I [Amycolatopsis jiangsuensis]
MADPSPRDPVPGEPEPVPPDGTGPSGPPDPSGSDSSGGAEDPGGAEARGGKRKRPFWQELLILIGAALVLTVLIQQFVAKVFLIPSASMETTLHGCEGCFGDRILVDRITYDFSDPEPGDVVVFRGPPSWSASEVVPQRSSGFFPTAMRELGSLVGFAPSDEHDFVKRVIAVGGQTVQCCDSQSRVLVDGKPLTEPYVHWMDPEHPVQKPFAPVTVPDGSLWVMGDNRGNSCDSRCQGGGGVRGTVPVDDVIGKARLIVLPPSRWGVVSGQNAQQASALGAPGWQQGLPLAAGTTLAFPVAAASRRMRRRG